MSSLPMPAANPLVAHVTVVESPGCHFCADAENALAEIAADYRLEVTRVDALSTDGVQLMQRHRAAMSPLVLLDGAFVSSGRLPRGKLRRLLATRPAGVAR